MKNCLRILVAIAAGPVLVPQVSADDEIPRPDDHAPLGVMGDHFHEAGEFMFSYRYMDMSMSGNAIGSTSISPEAIVSTIPNRFAPPPTLRVVPTEMSMEMHMLGLMYAPSDRVTIMAMTNHVSKDMNHITFAMGAGTTRLGTFRTKTSGIGDTSVSALLKISESESSRFHSSIGVSLPAGSTDETGTILTPMNMTPSPRLPYPMQLGSGTLDLLTGLTYTNFLSDNSSAGFQWRGTIRTGDNDGYSLGDEHRLSGWYSRQFSPMVSWSARLEWFDRGNIDGMDPAIMLPVQTADPDRQGATRIDLGLGINIAMAGGHRLAFEYLSPVDQDLDGPQLETDDQLIFGYQISF